ncbi:DUF3800 domain-containing protein [Sphaerimonospora cavernae]|uniref:DUF3800 domain-containing protein n=1 Tax=Sphaerimonospora cavernae TaxID=1740611 RepID=A0ABV6U382_9ACTN
MLLAYVDESYTRDRYYMAALLVPDHQAVSLARALDEVVVEASRVYGITPSAELHGTDLLHGNRDWEPIKKMPRARIGVYHAAFQAIADHEVAIILRGVCSDLLRRRYATPYPPHQHVLAHLLERVDDYAKAVDQHVLVIADEVGQQGEYRQDLRTYQTVGTNGWRARRLEQIVDTLHFTPSHSSRLIQAADLLAFLHHRIQAVAPQDERAMRANEALWQRIAGRIVHQHCWTPR